VVADICDSSLPAERYDYAVMSGVLHHLPLRDERLRALREARRLLKPGGRFYSYDPNGRSPSMWLYRHPRSPLYSSAGKTENEILLTRPQMHDELREAGFSDVDVRGLSGIAFRFVEGRVARRLLPLYNVVYESAIRWCGLERQLGTFLIATAVKA
jgi:SAM-dependent methyltransferase